jgi:nickel-type superoxide dismutase maturation protease
MVPTLRAGDRLLVVPTGRGRPGQLVAVRDPRQPDRIMVKRIEAVDAVTGHYRVAGDNPGASTDSRHFGPVPPRLVLGRVVYRYAPSSRAGRFPRGAR